MWSLTRENSIQKISDCRWEVTEGQRAQSAACTGGATEGEQGARDLYRERERAREEGHYPLNR